MSKNPSAGWPDRQPAPFFSRPADITGKIFERIGNASLGFLRLAEVDDHTPVLVREAYDLRIHPEALLLAPALLEKIEAFTPADQGHFSALLRFNDVQGIFGQTRIAGEAALGLTVVVQYDELPDYEVADEEWCDASGRPIRIIRELSDEYEEVRDYEIELEECLIARTDQMMPEETPEMQAYFAAFRETHDGLLVRQAGILASYRHIGPFYPQPPAGLI